VGSPIIDCHVEIDTGLFPEPDAEVAWPGIDCVGSGWTLLEYYNEGNVLGTANEWETRGVGGKRDGVCGTQ